MAGPGGRTGPNAADCVGECAMDTDRRRVVGRVTTRNGEIQLTAIEAAAEIHYEMAFNGVFLMATYNGPSSRLLTDVALEGVRPRRKHVELLIGGLGMGFALRQALTYPAIQTVRVVVLEPQVVTWNRTHLGNTDILDDPRTEVIVGDFSDYVLGTPRSYNGIAMDIDNGPDWVARRQNRRAYSLSMLQVLKTRLRSEGTLAIWAHAASRSYEQALREVFGQVRLQQAQDSDLNDKPLESIIYGARA